MFNFGEYKCKANNRSERKDEKILGIRNRRNTIFIILLVTLLLGLLPKTGEGEPFRKNGPKVLLFSAVDIRYLSEHLWEFGEVMGFDGFFLAYIAEWWTGKERMFENAQVIKDLNQKGNQYGIDRNFIKIALGYKILPDWVDDKEWDVVRRNFRNISELIKATGTRGIAIDTEYYGTPIWDSKADRYKKYDNKILKEKVYSRGRQLAQALTEVYPDIEIILLQEGAYWWFERKDQKYELWMDFFNGMASVGNKSGIVLAVEYTYSVIDRSKIKRLYDLNKKVMEERSENPAFWKEKCSLALGLFPLGETYQDKKARYSVSNFMEQFKAATSLSPRYVFVYGGGAAWWKMDDAEIEKYTANRWIWGKDVQGLPTDTEIIDYRDVLRKYKFKQ